MRLVGRSVAGAGGCCGRGGRATRGGRGSFLDFVKTQDTATTAVASIEDAAECCERADTLVRDLLGRIMRQRRSVAAAMDYIGALSRETRANCWELALRAGHEGPHRLQALLSRHKWSWEELRGLLPGLAQDVLRDDPDDLTGPGLAFDETADLRKGKSTACVSPQHAGVTGKVENCTTWVFAALVTALGQAWIDFDVYMPDCWAKDPQRRKKAGIPEKLAFATKPELAIAQAKRLMAAGLRVTWAAADEVYGRCGEFRAALRALSLAYVVIIPCDYRVTLAKDKVIRADQAIPGAIFERRSCGNGTKGPSYGPLPSRPRSPALTSSPRHRPPPATPRPPSASPPAPMTCRSTPEPRRCPPSAASPARPASPRSGCPPPRPPASSASPATGKPASSASPASPAISAGQHGADGTRPAPAGTTTPPAWQPSPPDPRRPEGGDSM